MKISSSSTLLLGAILAIVVYGSVFTVGEREVAHQKTLQRPSCALTMNRGCISSSPYINSVDKFPKRVQTIINPQEQFLTKEKKNLYVDFFVKWRIVDVEQFYIASTGNTAVAAQAPA